MAAKRIVRSYKLWIKTEHIEFCRRYVEVEKLAAMRAAPGNLDARNFYRDLGDGTTEVVFLSLWESMESVRRFTGGEISRPTGQGRSDESHMTVDREIVVQHHEVDAASSVSLPDWF